jgi:hypothetical protein
MIRIKQKMQDFKANVVPVESEVVLPKIAGPGKKTKIKDRQIGRNQAKKKPLLLSNQRKTGRLLSMVSSLKILK